MYRNIFNFNYVCNLGTTSGDKMETIRKDLESAVASANLNQDDEHVSIPIKTDNINSNTSKSNSEINETNRSELKVEEKEEIKDVKDNLEKPKETLKSESSKLIQESDIKMKIDSTEPIKTEVKSEPVVKDECMSEQMMEPMDQQIFSEVEVSTCPAVCDEVEVATTEEVKKKH